jgi:hypothetical protein
MGSTYDIYCRKAEEGLFYCCILHYGFAFAAFAAFAKEIMKTPLLEGALILKWIMAPQPVLSPPEEEEKLFLTVKNAWRRKRHFVPS